VREFSIPALAEIPATANLADAVFRRAAEQPQAAVLRRPSAAGSYQSWHDVTAAQFKDEVVAVAKGLVAAGIEAGDRVALMSHTRYEWTLIDYAIWAAGGVTVPVYETSSAEQAEWILANSGARACFVETAAYEQIIDSLRDQVPALEHMWRIEAGGAESLAWGGAGGPPGRPPRPPTRPSPSGPARPRHPTWRRSSTPQAPPDGPRAVS
jgi:long-chain acyl-CoA synthetase